MPVPLSILQENNFRSLLMNAAMMNRANDDTGMMMVIHLGAGRIPVSAVAQAMSRPMTNSHIAISNSSVSVPHAGDLAKINAVATTTKGSDAKELSYTIKDFAQAVIDSNEIAKEEKHEVGELPGTLSEKIVGKRSKPVIGSVLKGIEERIKSVNVL